MIMYHNKNVLYGNSIRVISSFKLLGVTFNDHLKWNDNVNILVKKASKRLYILRILRKSGVLLAYPLPVYFSLVRTFSFRACMHARFGIQAFRIISHRTCLGACLEYMYYIQVCSTPIHFKPPKSLVYTLEEL